MVAIMRKIILVVAMKIEAPKVLFHDNETTVKLGAKFWLCIKRNVLHRRRSRDIRHATSRSCRMKSNSVL
jgi:hypothetical protein